MPSASPSTCGSEEAASYTRYTEGGRRGRGRDGRRVRARRSAVHRHQRRAAIRVRRGRLLPGDCDTQEEVDYYWERLSDGGKEGPRGWLKDRFGLLWQVMPNGMDEIFSDPDSKRTERAMQAMFGMKKLDIAELRRAADGAPAT
jgi:3-demethylubiquinone-9 3-methyltransferase